MQRAPSSLRKASTMVIPPSKLSVLRAPLQPHSRVNSGPITGYRRDGYCWGDESDPGQHYIAGIVSKAFLEFSKRRGNDLSTPRPGFEGLREGCRWCLCVQRWKEALVASATFGEEIVPRVDLSATALQSLKDVSMGDLERFEWRREDEVRQEASRSP